MMKSWRCFPFIGLLFIFSCGEEKLQLVTTAEFAKFVEDTNYKTEAETFDWTIVQKNILEYDILYGVDWRCPDGLYPAHGSEPVRQVSYNDALAYIEWLGQGRLPSYQEYWERVEEDARPINVSTNLVLPGDQVNLVGNVWELTLLDDQGRVRLAGGSYLCDKNTCNGTDEQRTLHVDPTTGNSHIGFAIIK